MGATAQSPQRKASRLGVTGVVGRFDFVRTATFRFVVWYSVSFAVFILVLLVLLYTSTVWYLRNQADERVDAEMASLAAAYNTGGLERLNQAVIERASAPGGQFFYLFQDENGQKISGDLSALPPGAPNDPFAPIFFEYEVIQFNGEVEVRRAEGRVANLGEGGVVLVAFDVGQRDEIVGRISWAVSIAAVIGVLLALSSGVIASRWAASRADTLAKTAEGVMQGDLSLRAEVEGGNDEFSRLALHMNAMLEWIQRLMDAERHSSDAIAHDLRSPLSRLRNRVETALSRSTTLEEAQEILGQTLEDIDQVLATFNAILRMSRLDSGAEGRFVSTDISAVATEIGELFGPACEEAKLTFKSKISQGLKVNGDRDLLSQALANLLDNAVKYTPAGGTIVLSVKKGRENSATCSVTDTGPGIPEAMRKDVVRRFTRLDVARTQAGSGLGLALVDAVAERHGGEFVLEDGEGPKDAPGLKAILRLPRTV